MLRARRALARCAQLIIDAAAIAIFDTPPRAAAFAAPFDATRYGEYASTPMHFCLMPPHAAAVYAMLPMRAS